MSQKQTNKQAPPQKKTAVKCEMFYKLQGNTKVQVKALPNLFKQGLSFAESIGRNKDQQ